MKRVLIIGSPGAGKSTLACQLAERAGIPLVHLDRLYWKPGWVEPDKLAWRDTVKQLVQADSWIIDGHYTSTLDLRLGAADTVLLLDFPRWICLFRVLDRVLRTWGRTRQDMGSGCQERLDWEFLWFIWNFPTQHLPTAKEMLKTFPGRVIIFRHPREAQRFLLSAGG